MKILIYILDDHQMTIEAIGEIFSLNKIENYQLFTKEKEFLKALNEDVHVAIVDYYLESGTNGVEICKELFKSNPDCFVIMMSAQSHMKPVVDAMNAGVDRYVMKQNENWIEELIEFTKQGISHVQKDYDFFQGLLNKQTAFK